MDRLKHRFLYRLYIGMSPSVDSDGLYIGESVPQYDDVREHWGNIGFPIGSVKHQPFGLHLDYDKVILLEDDPGIDEYTQLWIDDLDADEPDYVVRRVMRSQTGIVRIEVSKVVG